MPKPEVTDVIDRWVWEWFARYADTYTVHELFRTYGSPFGHPPAPLRLEQTYCIRRLSDKVSDPKAGLDTFVDDVGEILQELLGYINTVEDVPLETGFWGRGYIPSGTLAPEREGHLVDGFLTRDIPDVLKHCQEAEELRRRLSQFVTKCWEHLGPTTLERFYEGSLPLVPSGGNSGSNMKQAVEGLEADKRQLEAQHKSLQTKVAELERLLNEVYAKAQSYAAAISPEVYAKLQSYAASPGLLPKKITSHD